MKKTGIVGLYAFSIQLPHYDDFDGVMWESWRNALAERDTQKLDLSQVYFFAGIKLAKEHGDVSFYKVNTDDDGSPAITDEGYHDVDLIPIEDVEDWELSRNSRRKRLTLVNAVGKVIADYVGGLIDPFVLPFLSRTI